MRKNSRQRKYWGKERLDGEKNMERKRQMYNFAPKSEKALVKGND